MADFTGFYFNNIHSSTYHLIRTSTGDRYETQLFPSFKDNVVELTGGYGKIYDNTKYEDVEFSIPIAFDSVTEEDFRAMRKWLEPNKLGEFRFDESPYKSYWAKLKSAPKFEYVCFMQQKENSFYGDEERVYKGEATLDFIVYNPFGYCIDNSTKMTPNGLIECEGENWQELKTYHPLNIKDNNVSEWGPSSGLLNDLNVHTSDVTYIKEDCEGTPEELLLENYLGHNVFLRKWDDVAKCQYFAKLYNPGDFPADYQLYFWFNHFTESDLGEGGIHWPDTEEIGDVAVNVYIYKYGETPSLPFVFYLTNLRFGDRILIDTKNHSLKVYQYQEEQTGYSENQKSLRYDLISNANWKQIPCTDSSSQNDQLFMKITCSKNLRASIKYNYKYY